MERKLFHLAIILLPLSYIFFEKKLLLYFLIPISVLIIGVDYGRRKLPIIKNIFDKLFGRILRDHEANNGWLGASFMAVAACLIFSFFPKIIALNAFTILAISDAVASLIGKKIPTMPFFEKSIAGSSAFFISSLIILIGYGIGFEQHFGYYLFGLLAICATTIIEARPSILDLDDNLTIPLTFSLVMIIFSFIWNYHY